MSTPKNRTFAPAGIGDVIAEVKRLRDDSYTKTGNWTLPQMCFHPSRSIPQPMNAVPASPQPQLQPAVLQRFQHYADHNAPMPGVTAPPGSEPSETPDADIIDYYLDRLGAADAFIGDYVDLGPRGPIPVGLYKGFVRGHAAHHLSFLTPTPR